MANIFEPDPQQEVSYQEWLLTRPKHVRKIAEGFRPWKLYRMKGSTHRATIHCFEEHKDDTVTVKVNILAQFNRLLFERQVFGVNPNDLEECDLPTPNESLGALLTTEEVHENIDNIRVLMGIEKKS